MKKILILLSAVAVVFTINNAFARNGYQGCCSHHSGVSHCDSSVNRLVCNDGTYSPSCRCN
ncbi:MAG: hypothetical protein JW985_02015 [Alphaproteobacteria bacterium]|nr:hypothetical protein [Alphaproteobacteria bacterium]HOY47353.1 hypothetical protein [Alphaproteobacteria bacterium]